MSEREDLFDGRYDPRRIRFLLLHFAALRGLAEWPPYARDAVQGLVREWELLADQARYDHIDCICHLLNDGYRSPGFVGSSAHPSAVPPGLATVADLVQAADLLPLPWLATRRIFELQGERDEATGRHARLRLWHARLAAQRVRGFPRPMDRLIEPRGDPELHWLRTGGGAFAVRLMAASLRGHPLMVDAMLCGR